jgi:hypothetical protein
MLSGKTLDPDEAEKRLSAWLAAQRGDGEPRCGSHHERDGGREAVAFVLAHALAEIGRVPATARAGTWVRFEADLLAPADSAKLVALGPTARPFTLPTSLLNGHVTAVAPVDRAGPWLLQLLLDRGSGPVPALEWLVLVDEARGRDLWFGTAPGERLAAEGDGASALAAAVLEARRSEHLEPLERGSDLDAVAARHARAMMAARRLAHDLGNGDPPARARRAGISDAEIGENVAHAATVALAHRAIWFSPSHRYNVLSDRFRRMGIGVSADPDGSVWVAELFASAP